jgi:hypothetical protein
MARSQRRSIGKPLLRFSGEIWTDAPEQATVVLPPAARGSSAASTVSSSSWSAAGRRGSGGISGGCLVIETDQPHAKVARRQTPAQDQEVE